MDFEFSTSLLEEYKKKLHYRKPLQVTHAGEVVDVTCAINNGDGNNSYAVKPSTPSSPQPNRLPKGCFYQFDESYKGKEDFERLAKMIGDKSPHCKLYIHRRDHPSRNGFEYLLRCSKYKVHKKDITQFEEGYLQKPGTKIETVKRKRTSGEESLIDRMDNKKLKGHGKRIKAQSMSVDIGKNSKQEERNCKYKQNIYHIYFYCI